jgi:hypothetical protein
MQNYLNADDLSLLIANREAAAEQFKAHVNALATAPRPEDIQLVQTLLHELAAQIPDGTALLEAPEAPALLSAIDRAELQKTEHRILYLDFLYMLYYLEHQEALETDEHAPKFKAKIQRLHTFLSSFSEL